MKKYISYIIISVVSIVLGFWLNQLIGHKSEKVESVKELETEAEVHSVNVKINQEDFQEFLWKFMTDSSFQFQRIKFPLEAALVNGDFETEFTQFEKNEWKMDRLFANENYRVQIYDNWEEQFAESSERLIVYQGIENGIRVKYYFKLISERWFLVKFADHST